MKSPYDVLQISEDATDEQIKEAYRTLARKYQGDDSGMSENKRKMKELDEAYDSIILNRSNYSGGSSRSSQNTTGTYQQSSTQSSDFGDIRSKIKSGRYDDALTILDGIPLSSRNAEWYYLKGTVFYRQGWLEEAEKNLGAACKMEPGNSEYNAAYNNLNQSRSGGYRTERTREKSGCSGCDMCSGLLCADCCCECMGGDLIRCC